LKVQGLDGRTYNWNLKGLMPKKNDSRPRSSYHKRARSLLGSLFLVSPVLEEVPLPGTAGLRFDFYLPSEAVAVEVQGEQHYKFSPRFHAEPGSFAAAKRRDKDKARWCEQNGITLITLPYDEDDDEWRDRITASNG
jgi:hypothetical protein